MHVVSKYTIHVQCNLLLVQKAQYLLAPGGLHAVFSTHFTHHTTYDLMLIHNTTTVLQCSGFLTAIWGYILIA